MANNQENQTVTDGSQNAGQTVTANTGTDYIANSSTTGPITASNLAANSVTPPEHHRQRSDHRETCREQCR